MKKPGPFIDFTPEQWREVRENHRRFCQPSGLGRPLLNLRTAYGAPSTEISDDEITLGGPRQRHPEWDAAISYWVRFNNALCTSDNRYDTFPVMYVARGFFGHSQRLAEPFGTETVVEGDGHAQAQPCISSFAQVDHLKLKPLNECPWLSRGREVIRYFHDSTEGRYHIPHMVTTGPCDTVNYATGSTALLCGFYVNPKAVHALLRMATDIIIDDILAYKKVVGERVVSDHSHLLDGCFCICSEIRSQFSAEHYEEFEAPYLRQIGEAVGPLHVHVSGPIEQSLPATLADENIKHIKFWVKDCDLKTVVDLIGDRVSFDLFRNDCMPSLAFESPTAFYRYIFESIKPETRWMVPTYEPDAFNAAYDAMDRAGTLPDQVREFGRMV